MQHNVLVAEVCPFIHSYLKLTRLHSSRMHTARSLTVSPGPGRGEGVSQHALRQTPSARRPPLPCGQNSWHTLLKILPCPKLCLLPGGGGAWSGGVYPSMHWGRPPLVDRILDTYYWKYYLAPNWWTHIKYMLQLLLVTLVQLRYWLLLAFGFLAQNFLRWLASMNGNLSFYECRLSDGDEMAGTLKPNLL